MSKVSIAAATALLIASMAPVGAHAQSGLFLVPDRQAPTQSKHAKARVPANARGSARESGAFPTPVYQSPMYAPDAAPSRSYSNPGIPDFQLGSRG
jgi:hypothetical protein